MKYTRLFGILCLVFGVWLSVSAQEGDNDSTTLLLIGGFYVETFPGFVEAALLHAGEDRVYILVVPAAYAYDADVMLPEELLINTGDAEYRRRQLEDICN